MAIVKVNAIDVPEGMEAVFEERFAKRAGQVESSPGFEEFQLLRPVEGTTTYLVYTRWASEEAFQGWMASSDFAAAHAGPPKGEGAPAGGPPAGHGQGGGHPGGPAAPSASLWSFEVLERVTAPA